MKSPQIKHAENCMHPHDKPSKIYAEQAGRKWPVGWKCDSCGACDYDGIALLR